MSRLGRRISADDTTIPAALPSTQFQSEVWNMLTSIIDVAAYATGGDGTVGDPWTGWDTAVTYSAGRVYYFRPGYFSLAATWLLDDDRVHILGAGIRATFIVFAPTAVDTCLEVNAGGGNAIWQGSIRNLTFWSDDAVWAKVGIALIDCRSWVLSNVEIVGSVNVGGTLYWGDVGAGSTGICVHGRDFNLFENVYVTADSPLAIGDNPNSAIDIDHTHFSNTYLIANANPVVTIADGVNLSHVTFDGAQAWVKGTAGLLWDDTVAVNASFGLRLDNVRWEQAEGGATDFVHIHRTGQPLYNLRVTNAYASAGADGFYLRGIYGADLDSCMYPDVAGVALDANATVTPLTWRNCYWQAGSTASLGTLRSPLLPPLEAATAPLPPDAFYTADPNGAYAYTASMYRQGVSITLADNATHQLTPQTVLQGFLTIVDNLGAGAIYFLRPGTSAIEVSDPVGIYDDTKDNANTINVYYDADNYFYIQNKWGAEIKIRYVIDGTRSDGY